MHRRLDKITEQKWKGYTLDELNFRRAVNAVEIEMMKERVTIMAKSIVPGQASANTSGRSLSSKLLGALDYADYAVLGFRLFKLFRRGHRSK